MTEIDERLYWFLLILSIELGFRFPQSINDLDFFMLRRSEPGPGPLLDALVKKQVLDLSPDHSQVKMTDYGLELFRSKKRAQKEWEAQSIGRIPTANRDQILIKAGGTIRANRVLRDIFQR